MKRETTTPLSDQLEALAKAGTQGEWENTQRSGYREVLAPDSQCDWYGQRNRHAILYCDTEIDEREQEANAEFVTLCWNNRAVIIAALRERGE